MDEAQKQKAETLIKTLGTIAHEHEAKRLEVLQEILVELKSLNGKMETMLELKEAKNKEKRVIGIEKEIAELKRQLEDRQFLKGTTWGDFES